MNLSIIKTALFKARQTSPTALMVVGIAGAVGAAVLASRATLKAAPAFEYASHELELIEGARYDVAPDGERYFTDKDVMRHKAAVVTGVGVEIVKLYAPSVVVMGLSIAAISGGHVVMLRRNATLAGALTLTEKAFSEYRKSVQQVLGEEQERELRAGVSIEQVHDTKNGVVTDKVVADPSRHSQYARLFDETNPNWDKHVEYNLLFLRSQQEYANQKLRVQGWLLLNDVYKALGYEPTTAGAVVGWVVGESGDNYVDFGIYNPENGRALEIPTSRADNFFALDFNVDGVVYHLIGDSK